MATESILYGAVQTAYVSYVSYNLQTLGVANLVTFWPTPYTTSPNILAATTNIVIGDVVDGILTLPDANEVSLGMNVFIRGDSTNTTTFTVNNNIGMAIQTIDAGQVFWIQLTAYTSDTGGIWIPIQQGAGTSSADAATLQGYGLSVEAYNTSKLNTVIPTSTQNTTYTVLQSDQSSLILLGGGSYVVTIPPFFNGFDVSFSNTTDGVVTLTPASGTINGGANLPLYPTQTTTVVSDGANLWTLGLGQSSSFVDVVVNVEITAAIISAGFINLNQIQASANIIQFYTTGANIINNDVIVYFGSFSSNWIVSNFCANDGTHTLAIQLGLNTSPVGTQIIVPYNENLSVYSATNPNTSILQFYLATSTILFGNGSMTEPSVTFQTDSTSGMYLKSQYNPTISAHGIDVLQFSGTDTTEPQLLANPLNSVNSLPTYSFQGFSGTGISCSTTTGQLNFHANATGGALPLSLTETRFNINVVSSLNLLVDGSPDIIGIGSGGNTGMGIGIQNSTNQIQFYSSTGSPPTYAKIASLVDIASTETTFSLFEEAAPTAIGYMRISGTGGAQVLALGTTANQILLTAGTPNTISFLNNTYLTGGFGGNPAMGDMCYFNGTNWVDLPIGTLGQHLTITATGPGGALIPAWGI